MRLVWKRLGEGNELFGSGFDETQRHGSGYQREPILLTDECTLEGKVGSPLCATVTKHPNTAGL